MAARNSTVILSSGYVDKICPQPECVAEKYRAIHRLSMDGGFEAPRVLEVQNDRVRLERIRSITSISKVYLGDKRYGDAEPIMFDVGRILGLIHDGLASQVQRTAAWSPPTGFDRSLQRYAGRPIQWKRQPHAVLHCDYSFANVFVRHGNPSKIVILDPCANNGSTFSDWTFGPVALDLGKMLACLEGQVPLRRFLSLPSRARISVLQEQFLNGYRSVRSGDWESAEVRAFAYAAAAGQFVRRFGPAGIIPTAVLYNRMRKNYPMARPLDAISSYG